MKDKCDRCGKTKQTKSFWFENGTEKWSLNWCEKCHDNFINSEKNLKNEIYKLLHGKSYWIRLKEWIKKLLRRK